MDQVDVDGTPIAYRRRGDGPVLVLLHGALCDSRIWSAELDALADEFSVIAWDAPGCGGSTDPPDHFRMPDFARSLAGLLDVLDAGAVHLLGHSFGSTLALELYRQRPDLVRTLILVGGYAGWAGSLPPDEVQQRVSFALEAAALGAAAFDPRSMRGLFSPTMPADRATQLSALMKEARPAATRTMAHALAEADLRALLPQIAVPTLILNGENDERADVGVATALHAAIPTSTLVLMPGLGHECFLEDEDLFQAEVRKYLRSI
jgi:pimeloyl-ACP methyl ester carboxylesterase